MSARAVGRTIIAYDLGTGGAKASLYQVDGTCLASTFVSYETLYPDTGWHEQRPSDWWNAVVESTRALLARKLVPAADIECLAISGQSLAVIPVDAQGRAAAGLRCPSGPTRGPRGRRRRSSRKWTGTAGT